MPGGILTGGGRLLGNRGVNGRALPPIHTLPDRFFRVMGEQPGNSSSAPLSQPYPFTLVHRLSLMMPVISRISPGRPQPNTVFLRTFVRRSSPSPCRDTIAIVLTNNDLIPFTFLPKEQEGGDLTAITRCIIHQVVKDLANQRVCEHF